jgi:hypothetical protein
MKKTLFYALAVCVLFTSSGRSSAEERVTVSGKVLLVGNVPFVEMVIHDSQGRDWLVEGDDRQLLDAYTDQEVTVQGFSRETEVQLANSEKKFKRYALSRIVVIGPRP